MKYMTFNSSCSYAGLANLLFFCGVDTGDREIALDMGLPYLFAKEGDRYLAGPMLQSGEWFALYLLPRGFVLRERELHREQVCEYLRTVPQAMLGVRISAKSKHAVIYTGMEGGKYCFLNNKWENSEEPDKLFLSREELMERLEERAVVAVLEKTEAKEVDRHGRLETSAETLLQLDRDLEAFCAVEQGPEEIKKAMNTLFRAILLDGITMLELLGETVVSGKLKVVQGQLMQAVRENRAVKLNQVLDMELLREGIREYEGLILNAI